MSYDKGDLYLVTALEWFFRRDSNRYSHEIDKSALVRNSYNFLLQNLQPETMFSWVLLRQQAFDIFKLHKLFDTIF